MKRQSSRKFSILALLFLAISVPLALYSVTNLTSFDTRNKAADLTLDVETCQIKFPYVNPSTIELNKTVQAQVSAYTPGEAITQVMVMDRAGNSIVKKDFDTGVDKVSENFTLTPKEAGDLGILGTLTTDKGTRPCVVQSNKQVMAVDANNAPEFSTQPTAAKPSNVIKVNDSYQYQLQATDGESDNINYAFSFTPDSDWLKATVVENGASGKLTLKFSGTPDKPGSYLANVFIHDGYNSHLRAQTWVINVDQDKNDTPKVTIIKPSADTEVSKGENVTISWEGADLNQIVRYELYVSTNPGNANTWIAIDKSISPKVGNYIFNTKDIDEGTYQFIVRAVDNYTPPGIGTGISPKVTIGKADDGKGPDDGVVLQEAQIVNISPSNESSIKNKNAIISATLIPSKDATINKETIKIVFDDQDITSKTRTTQGTDNSYVLSYTPETEHKEGAHKVTVTFEDSKGNKAEKSWTFTVIPEETENTDTYNIFGFQIPKRIVWIVLAGLAILLLALIVPWLLYLAWRGTKDNDEYEITYKNSTPIQPDNTPVTFVQNNNEEVVKKLEEKVIIEEKKEIENSKPKNPIFSFNKTEVVKEEVKPEVVTPVVPPVLQPEPMTPPVINNVITPTPVPTPIPAPVIVETPKVETPVVLPVVEEIKEVKTEEIAIPEKIEETPVQINQDIQAPTLVVTPDENVEIEIPKPTDTISEPVPVVVENEEDEYSSDDILANTNKELEELAEKLKKKEEMLSEFLPTQSNTAPSSTPSDVTNTPATPVAN